VLRIYKLVVFFFGLGFWVLGFGFKVTIKQ
jgi:hypothetical protein